MTTIQTVETATDHPYITRREGFAGAKPIIKGTRLKVSYIVTEYELMGWSPDEIVTAHPHLTLAQVHDALSYYYDHTEEIHREIRESEEFVKRMEERFSGSVLEEKRRAASNLHG
ncbi:MAG: DUF433 domain-containing protein [Candidatus Poribacteria bacterium]|nr:DUF433 domain-containing protein [Candidatus Poribacteria bacterium]